MIAKHNPSPLDALSLDYDTALGSMTEEGSVADDVLKDESSHQSGAHQGGYGPRSPAVV